MSFSQNLKSAMWTEAEVLAIVGGGIAAHKFLNKHRIFKKYYPGGPPPPPGSFQGTGPAPVPGVMPTATHGPDPDHLPIYVKHFGAVKAIAGTLASTYVKNPWVKMALIGVAVQGTIEEINALQHKHHYHIGSRESELDAQLKQLAHSSRIHGMDEMGDHGNRFSSEVAGDDMGAAALPFDPTQGNRYTVEVAGYDEMGEVILAPFSIMSSDETNAS